MSALLGCRIKETLCSVMSCTVLYTVYELQPREGSIVATDVIMIRGGWEGICLSGMRFLYHIMLQNFDIILTRKYRINMWTSGQFLNKCPLIFGVKHETIVNIFAVY